MRSAALPIWRGCRTPCPPPSMPSTTRESSSARRCSASYALPPSRGEPMRPRAESPSECHICTSDPKYLTPRERPAWEYHYEQHFRAHRRREQYRRYRAKRQAEQQNEVAGYLHDLRCKGGHTRRAHGCTPIPVFRRPVLEVVA